MQTQSNTTVGMPFKMAAVQTFLLYLLSKSEKKEG